MRWCVELISRAGDREANVNFGLDRLNILLHIAYRRSANLLVLNRRDALGWGLEMIFPLPPTWSLPNSVVVSIRQTGRDEVLVSWPGGEARPVWVSFSELTVCASWVEGPAVWYLQGTAPRLAWQDWRLATGSSGFAADTMTLRASIAAAPPPGACFLIRAKNEAPTVQACLRSIGGLADEIIFTDNDSSDATYNLAERMKGECFELKTFSYPYRIPRAGAEHAREVFSGGCNTLGHYYNWCLAHAGVANIIKWDADYVALRDNLAEMIDRFNLRTRGDNFVLWFSGLEVYTDGVRYWVDENSAHSEFRAFSLRHGGRWVNLPPWEEIDQATLFRAQKLFFTRPVYLELFRLDEIEFRDRGLFADDTRDRERFGYIRQFRETGEVPAHFRPIDGLDDERLAGMKLSPRELHLADYLDCHFRAMPRLLLTAGEASIGFDMLRQADVAVFIISCARNTARQAAIRDTWAGDLARLGIPYFFIVGRPGQEARIIGDTLFLDVPDSYEFLASKVVAAMAFSLARMNVDYVFKIDDDGVLDADRLLLCDYRDADFTGGGLAGGAGSLIDWHAGKCRNEQLHRAVQFPEREMLWVGGQFGYFLSQTARRVLVQEQAAMRRSLYEDHAVTRLLAGHGIRPQVPFGNYRSVKYADGDWAGRDDVVVVADTPDAQTQLAVYAALEAGGARAAERQRRADGVRVTFDWMDFEGVRQRLTVAEAPEVAAVPEPAAMAAPETPVRRGRARLAAVRSAG